MAEIVLASCNDKYYDLYGATFENSLKKINQPYHIQICENNPWNDVSYYACARYLILPEMIEEHGSVFVSDIDAIFFRPIPFPDTKIGYVETQPKAFREEWEQRGMHLLAGVFFCSDVDIAVKIRDRILELPHKWFVDQIAIWEIVKNEESFTLINKPPRLTNQVTKEDFVVAPRGKGRGRSDAEHNKRMMMKQWIRFLKL
jgi:hypothetical protein